jgi:PPOX class probable F420-dependent enzyme
MIDLSTEFGRRVARRLEEEYTLWLTTVDASGAPQPRPVWFLWQGETFLIYSRPETHKVSHIRHNPRVAPNSDSDSHAGGIVVFTGEARIPHDGPPAVHAPRYIEKYREALEDLDTSPAEFARAYSAPIRVTPSSLRGL